ncbi:hypothetical protein KI387_000444, partial [Taxus chinensis]
IKWSIKIILNEITVAVKENILKFKPSKKATYPQEEVKYFKAWNIDLQQCIAPIQIIDRSIVQWIPSSEGWYKLNFDGASKGNPGPARGGVLIKNHNGHLIATYEGLM